MIIGIKLHTVYQWGNLEVGKEDSRTSLMFKTKSPIGFDKIPIIDSYNGTGQMAQES